MTPQDVIREVEVIVGAPEGTLYPSDALESIKGWDSMATVMFIAMADEKAGQSVSAKDLAACKTLTDLVALLPSNHHSII
jgi:acyl carrier protein